MSKVRASHVTKTQADLREYIDNAVRPAQAPAPTTETALLAVDSTATPATEPDDLPTASYATRRPESPLKDSIFRWLKENGFASLIVGGLAWMALTVYGLNRELGETKEQLRTLQQNLIETKSEIAAVESRGSRETERVE